MKTYEEYVQMLTVALEEQSSSRGLCFRKSFANNQISLDAVCLKGEKISPVLYMQSYYEQFCSGTAVEDIAKQMLQLLYTAPTNHIEVETKRLLSYEENENRIFPAVINYSQNEEFLKSVCHKFHIYPRDKRNGAGCCRNSGAYSNTSSKPLKRSRKTDKGFPTSFFAEIGKREPQKQLHVLLID